MLYGQAIGRNLTAKEWLQQSRYTFHATGSRYFGTATDESDWDYFVQFEASIYDDLVAAGFVLDTVSYAHDRHCVAIYRRDDVHVQVVRNARIKQRVQERLYPILSMFQLTKEQERFLWQQALSLYEDGYNGHSMGIKLAAPGICLPDIWKPAEND